MDVFYRVDLDVWAKFSLLNKLLGLSNSAFGKVSNKKSLLVRGIVLKCRWDKCITEGTLQFGAGGKEHGAFPVNVDIDKVIH